LIQFDFYPKISRILIPLFTNIVTSFPGKYFHLPRRAGTTNHKSEKSYHGAPTLEMERIALIIKALVSAIVSYGGTCAMRSKYCLKCFLEYKEVVKVIAQQNKVTIWDRDSGKPEYRCMKRSHVLKGAGLSKPELEKLERFND